jgi:hypothetical protein
MRAPILRSAPPSPGESSRARISDNCQPKDVFLPKRSHPVPTDAHARPRVLVAIFVSGERRGRGLVPICGVLKLAFALRAADIYAVDVLKFIRWNFVAADLARAG